MDSVDRDLHKHLNSMDNWVCPYCDWEGKEPIENEEEDYICPKCLKKLICFFVQYYLCLLVLLELV
jgi:hypothetical protein